MKKIILEILSKLNSEKIVTISGHGYTRTWAGFVFSVYEKAKKKFQQVSGSKR